MSQSLFTQTNINVGQKRPRPRMMATDEISQSDTVRWKTREWILMGKLSNQERQREGRRILRIRESKVHPVLHEDDLKDDLEDLITGFSHASLAVESRAGRVQPV